MARMTVKTMGWLRTSVGVALIVAPGASMRVAGGEPPSGATLLLMRTIGVRDLVLGLGTLASHRSGVSGDERRWLVATTASDALDTVAGLAARRTIGTRDSVVAAGLALAFVGGDLMALAGSGPATGVAPS
jgi:hypothetical protein